MKRDIQVSESVQLGVVLALSGGFMDAYSFLCRDQVFANAQTGNILLLGVHLAGGEWAEALHYFCPVLCFAAGIIVSIVLRRQAEKRSRLHWRQNAVAVEAVILAGVCFFPQSMNLIANSLISLGCGIQLETFSKINGSAIATTMCIGNLRSGTENLCRYVSTRDAAAKKKAGLYFGIILSFTLGAIWGNFMVKWLGEYALFVCSALLLAAFFMMFQERGNKVS